MKKTVKSVLAIILTLVLLLSTVSVSLAKNEVTPVIVVSGMNSFPLAMSDSGEIVYPPSTDTIMSVVGTAVPSLLKFLATGDWQKLGDEVMPAVYTELFEIIACDENGDSIASLKTSTFPKSVDNYPEHFAQGEETEDEIGIIKGLIDDIGGENVYFFNYDWRLDPMGHADDLNAFIENVKSEKKCSKVSLIPCSMGGTVTNSYLKKYGSASVERIIYAMTAFQGLEAVGELFCRNLDVNTDTLMEYLFSMQRDDLLMQILMAMLQTSIEMTPAISEFLDAFIDESLVEIGDRAYNEIMADSFGSLPGLWALVPDSYYAAAKAKLFKGGMPKGLEEKTDAYHYGVQTQAESLMKQAAENGTYIYVLSSYGFVGGPYTKKAMTQTDCLIETANQSGWATTAPFGKTFGEDYVALGTKCADKSHNHVSTDGIIDASTCMFPENTWFIKYNKHVGIPYGTDCQKLMNYLVTSDEYVTVHSDKDYPQFVSYNKVTGKFRSLTGDKIKISVTDGQTNFFTRFLEIVKTLIANIQKALGLV